MPLLFGRFDKPYYSLDGDSLKKVDVSSVLKLGMWTPHSKKRAKL